MQIYDVVIEPERAEHIAGHGLSVADVEEVVFGRHVAYRVRPERYVLIGPTEGERCLIVVLALRGHGTYGLVTARDATESERRLYQSWEGR